MFNVLPEQFKKTITTEYYVRLGALVCCVVCVLEVCTIVFLLPSWMVGTIQKKELTQHIAIMQDLPVARSSNTVADTITSLNQLLEVVTTTFVYEKPTSLLDEILKNKNSNIHIIDYSSTYVDSTHASLSITGKSVNRNALVTFVKTLQQDKKFSNIELPVSDLARDSDIPFTLQIKEKI